MEERWRRRVLVPLLGGVVGAGALVAVMLVAPATGRPSGAGAPAAADESPAACTARVGQAPDDPGRAAWFTMRPRTERDGALAGYVLRLAVAGRDALAALDVPPESFAAGPFGESVLVGSDDGTSSKLRLVAPNGCGRVLAIAGEILRRATIDPSGQRLITFRLGRADRTDLGIWTAPIDDETAARQLLPPLATSPELDARFGSTFATDFLWSTDGGRLVVQSCGESQCRFRIVADVGGRTWTLDRDGIGAALALVGNRLIAFSACAGRPCPILAVDIDSGATDELVDADGNATVIPVRSGALLVAELFDGIGIVDLENGRRRTLTLPAFLPGIALAAPGESGGIGLPPGWIALAPDGRLPEPLFGGRLFALELESSRLVSLFGGTR